jgi:hypothetical protein
MRRLAPLAALILVAGCGDSTHPTVSARVVAAAAAKTTRAGTALVFEGTKVSVHGVFLGLGVVNDSVDSRRGNAYIVFNLSPLERLDGSDPDSVSGRLVYVGDNAFLSTPAVWRRLPGRKRWLEVKRRRIDTSSKLYAAGMLDPTTPVDHVRAAVGAAEELGTHNSRGVVLKHYRVEVDYRLYVSLAKRSRRAALQKLVDKLGRTFGKTRFPVEVWIGPDGTIRRTKGTIEEHGGKLEYTLDLTGIGTPRRIIRPPANLVHDGRIGP